MKGQVTLDKAGRLVLPKPLRNELHLSAGDTLDFALEGEEVRLRPRRAVPPLQRERGVWVLRTGQPLTASEVNETLRRLRDQRGRRNAGDAG